MKQLTVLFFACLLMGCASQGTAPVATSPHGGTSPATLPTAVHWVVSAAEYESAMRQTFRYAAEKLEAQTGWRAPGSWAVSLDADETILGNGQYEEERGASGTDFTSDGWAAWVKRHKAVALPGAVAFLQRIHELGGKIVIVTNRRQSLCDDTEANLRAVGLSYDLVLCRTTTEEKEPRWSMVRAGTAKEGVPPLEIIMWLGDNIQDFPNLDQSLRGAPEEDFAPFGERYFVMPNPMYGSWEKAQK